MRLLSFCTALSGVLAAAGALAAPSYPFDRYQVILDRQPFGEAAAPASDTASAPTADMLFARTLRLCALIELADGTVRAGIVDTQTKSTFYLRPGESEEGLDLLSVDLEDEVATVRKGGLTVDLKMEGGSAAAAARPPPVTAVTRRMTYAERRRMRAAPPATNPGTPGGASAPVVAQPAPPPPQPRLTGKALEKHLREYQLEVIRQGLPPLPIPLTPQQDAQLVKEGVLPPLQAGSGGP